MNKEQLNQIMNCQCLQTIIQSNMDKHDYEDTEYCNRPT